MTKKVIFSICTAMIVVFSFGFFKVNFLDRKESKLTVTNVDLQENCIYAIAKNQLYDADDEYIIHGASDYLKGQVQLSQIKEGETIIVISNGKVLQSDPYQVWPAVPMPSGGSTGSDLSERAKLWPHRSAMPPPAAQ